MGIVKAHASANTAKGRRIDLILAIGSGLVVLFLGGLTLYLANREFVGGSEIGAAILEALAVPRISLHLFAAIAVIVILHIAFPLAVCAAKRAALADTRINDSPVLTAAVLVLAWLWVVLVNAQSFPESLQVDLLGISDAPVPVVWLLQGFGMFVLPLMAGAAKPGTRFPKMPGRTWYSSAWTRCGRTCFSAIVRTRFACRECAISSARPCVSPT